MQEAGQFSAFKLFSANPHAGIALSLVLRINDIILLMASFFFISSEGIDIFKIINKKLAEVVNSSNKNHPCSCLEGVLMLRRGTISGDDNYHEDLETISLLLVRIRCGIWSDLTIVFMTDFLRREDILIKE